MKKLNNGSVTVEACLVVPIFLFFMLSMVNIAMLFMAEARIHQSLSEASIYTAQYEYLERKIEGKSEREDYNLGNKIVLYKQFFKYLNNDSYVEKVVSNGKKGILLTIEEDEGNPKIFIAKARYKVKFSLPMLGNFHVALSNQVKQKYFIGYSKEEKSDSYVYVTPYQSVYHRNRNCTHLCLDIRESEEKNKGSYKPCSFCGKYKNENQKIYVSKSSRIYHNHKDCSGLKRTVTRVKLKEVNGLRECQRCGK